ncbi:Nucleotidyltransferase domain-containing protein [Rhizobium mongolense subsp. loessense]|uniref:Nucleotidyltransferase domain-containing protein n=1 Tax=Rhizobium mongolense subsp. loessense TaxID=158890 RepID=A0A1G4T5K6_9HYPH|nr:nucleotidyltransferase domain-containing protein [Rhizobium mongolense]SCW76566.1 Nucleotidyltransferase domain-containing protein [Rhizobium mongolense subsp. loessense]
MPKQIDEALRMTGPVLSARFDGYSFAFAAGSIIRGEGTENSDIDLVVVFEKLDRAWRESFVENGLPFEAFVHDLETLNWFFERDLNSGHPLIVHMVASGRIIGPGKENGRAWQSHAAQLLKDGPPELAGQELDALRYQITDMLYDLRGERSGAEIRAIASQLYQPLADLMLLGRGTWSGKGKWIPRLLKQLDNELFETFDMGFKRAAEGRAEELCRLTESELARKGGRYFHGDRREAPFDARKTSAIPGRSR